MKIVMTIMVRDEADIITAMIEHHLAQGVSMIIVTDNGSIDGTREILSEYGERGVLTLHDDPVHEKQQHSTVTKMAREAFTDFGADWVINADADEFWFPVDRTQTLHETFSNISTELQSFLVPVVDMTGPAAVRGSEFSRIRLRDLRPQQELTDTGLLSHSTSDAVHVGRDDIVVAQGNHSVNLESRGEPMPEFALEVLHVPWRSWEQYERKVENAGRAYEASANLVPSPNHHGMRDYRRLQDGVLLAYYLLRHPTEVQIDAGLKDGSYVEERGLLDYQRFAIPDVLFNEGTSDIHRTYGHALVAADERANDTEHEILLIKDEKTRLAEQVSALEVVQTQGKSDTVDLKTEILILEDQVADMQIELVKFHERLAVRLANNLAPTHRRVWTIISRFTRG